MDKVFFDSWESIVRTSIISVCAYVALVLMLRIVGNRTLSQLNAFDFIVTVALGSTLSTVLLNKDIALADGVLAFLLLIGLQFILSWLSRRYIVFQNLVKTEPFLLFYDGKYLEGQLRRHRISKSDILQVIRSAGISRIEKVGAIVLEANGTFSVIKKAPGRESPVLKNVVKH